MTSFPCSISTKYGNSSTTATPVQITLWQHRKVPSSNQVVRLHGVYDASGTILGEVSYFLRRALFNQHCALCDITHSTFTRRRSWDVCVDGLGIEFQLHHRNDAPSSVTDTTGYSAPCVVSETENGTFTVLVNSDELARCKNSPELLMKLIISSLDDDSERQIQQ